MEKKTYKVTGSNESLNNWLKDHLVEVFMAEFEESVRNKEITKDIYINNIVNFPPRADTNDN